ncbi:hypothetical protein GOV03_00640 [Candidatus Woesearchaeota archaeon]|nr:hypothetical protein [Candidatus Woesearchaeota archaeon]
MNEQEITDVVLGKANEAYIKINSLADEDGSAMDHFRELLNFYNRPQDREVYLRDFKRFYFSDVGEEIEETERKAAHCNQTIGRSKSACYFNVALAVGSGAGIYFHWTFGIPMVFAIRWLNRAYDHGVKATEDKERYETSLKELKSKEEQVKEMKPEVLEEVLEKNKESLMEIYHELQEILN